MPRYRNQWVKAAWNQGSKYVGFTPAVAAAAKKALKQEVKKELVRNIRGSGYGMKSTKRIKPKSNINLTKDVKSCKSMLKSLKADSDASTGNMTYRVTNTGVLLAATNAQASVDYETNTTTGMEYALQYLKYFNPAVPGTLTTADATSGTYQRNVLFKSVTQQLSMRNNYQTDARLKVYLCKCRDDTNQSPRACWVLGIADGGNASTVDQPQQYPTDYNIFNDIWKPKVVYNGVLSPGQTATVSHTDNDIEYDSSIVDTHSLTYQREYKSSVFLVVLEGTAAHDSVSTVQQGQAAAGIDIIQKVVYKIRYDAGVNISYLHLINNLTPMTGTPLQSHQPIPDNIGYSLT